jgi:hypothetical protein
MKKELYKEINITNCIRRTLLSMASRKLTLVFYFFEFISEFSNIFVDVITNGVAEKLHLLFSLEESSVNDSFLNTFSFESSVESSRFFK